MELLEDSTGPYGRMMVTRSKLSGAIHLHQGTCWQSCVEENGQSRFAYVHALRNLALLYGARDVAVLGGGGGSLSRLLCHDGCQVVQVDINPDSFRIAKSYFDLPDAVECVVADARTFIAHETRRFDAILIDVFGADGAMPRHLSTWKFFAYAYRRLRRPGFIAVNLVIDDPLDPSPDRIAASLALCGLNPSVVEDGSHQGNVLVVGGLVVPAAGLALGHEPDRVSKPLARWRPRPPVPAAPFSD